jgi:hypothetical protein
MSSFLLAATSSWFQPLVWTDYRLALLFMVLFPLVLLIWAFVKKAEAMVHLLVIYWRVASLLAINIYLMIAALPISFGIAFLGRVLIPLSLWFWVDLNDEIEDRPESPLKVVFSSWRWAVSIYSGVGAIGQLAFMNCAFKSQGDLIDEPLCRVWLDAPWMFKEIFHSHTSPQFLGFLGLVGLVVYVFYLSYFVMIKFARQGRSATGR